MRGEKEEEEKEEEKEEGEEREIKEELLLFEHCFATQYTCTCTCVPLYTVLWLITTL